MFILDNELNQLFRFDAETYDEYDDYHMKDPEKTYQKPENEMKEILGIKNGKVEILNGKGEITFIDLPQNLLIKKE